MKVDLISDIHIDFYIDDPTGDYRTKRYDKFIEEVLVPTGAEVLSIAGDIGHYNKQNRTLLTKLSNYYEHVFFTLGNHDFWLISSKQEKRYKFGFNRVAELLSMDLPSNVHFVDNVINVDNFKVSGTIGFYDGSFMPDAEEWWKEQTYRKFSDYRRIPEADSYRYLFDNYKYKGKLEKVDLMISHMNPSNKYEHQSPVWRDNSSTLFYCFDGTELRDSLDPKVWHFGHTHEKINYRIKGTEFICNPFGYPHETGEGKGHILQIEI